MCDPVVACMGSNKYLVYKGLRTSLHSGQLGVTKQLRVQRLNQLSNAQRQMQWERNMHSQPNGFLLNFRKK